MQETQVLSNRADAFVVIAKPLVKWLHDNMHPHAKIIITPTSAELLSGETAFTTHEYLRAESEST